jgi:RNA polymerase sigma-70 factor (ECF subfamily)
LSRERFLIKEAAPRADDVVEPTEPQARALLEQYIAAFEDADPALLKEALRHDAALEMIGSRTWFSGRTTCLPFIATYVLGSPGDWRRPGHHVRSPADPVASPPVGKTPVPRQSKTKGTSTIGT